MTAVAERLLVDFQTLPPEEKLLVLERVISVTERTQLDAINRLRGASAGKQLLSKLLETRTEERAGG